tara:strand:+ start:395 stop:631 length:237 start_codon:yes stop_codon:yes gene_type:complete
MKNKQHLQKVLDIMRQNLDQEMFNKFSEDASAAPTNNVGSGNIAGTVEAGDDPPVRRKKKYIYQKGVRKLWKLDGRRS